MYTIAKQFTFSASHQLDHLPEDHQCARLHGHNYVVEIVLSAPFGKTDVHPMHMDADDDTHKQVERLKTELPKD